MPINPVSYITTDLAFPFLQPDCLLHRTERDRKSGTGGKKADGVLAINLSALDKRTDEKTFTRSTSRILCRPFENAHKTYSFRWRANSTSRRVVVNRPAGATFDSEITRLSTASFACFASSRDPRRTLGTKNSTRSSFVYRLTWPEVALHCVALCRLLACTHAIALRSSTREEKGQIAGDARWKKRRWIGEESCSRGGREL